MHGNGTGVYQGMSERVGWPVQTFHVADLTERLCLNVYLCFNDCLTWCVYICFKHDSRMCTYLKPVFTSTLLIQLPTNIQGEKNEYFLHDYCASQ